MGNVYVKLGKTLEAIEAFVKSLEIKTALGRDADFASASLNIGNLFYRIAEFDRAEKYYLDARAIYLEQADMEGVSKTDSNLGALYNAMGNYKKSQEHHESALKYYQNHGMQQLTANTLNNLGNVFQKTGEYSRALKYYRLSIAIKTELQDNEGIANSEKNLGETYYLMGDYAAALKHTKNSLSISTELQKDLLRYHNFLQISNIYAALKDYQKAYEALSEHVELDKTLHSESSLSAIAEMMGRLDNRQRIQELNDLRGADAQKEAELKRLTKHKLLLILAALVASLFTMSMVILYNQKQREVTKSKKLQIALENLNNDLEKRIASEIDKYRQQQLVVNQKSKLESLGILAAGIAHEINQPLSAISMSLDNIENKIRLSKIDNTYLEKKSQSMKQDVDRIRKIIDHVRLFSRFQSDDDIELVDINNTISESLIIFEPVLKKAGITLSVDLCTQKAMVLGNRFKLEQVLFNLLSNAVDTIIEKLQNLGLDADKSIYIKSECKSGCILIKVKDSGMGIPEAELTKIFDPFYTTKNPDKGTGLGLAISYGIINDMEGSIKVYSESGIGSTFELSLPLIKV